MPNDEQDRAKVTRVSFTSLPPSIKLEDTIAELDTRAVEDPEAGRDTEREFMLRNAGI